MSEATVEITEAEPKAVRVNRKELRVGDSVFDVWGGTHKVARVRQYKRVTLAVREDGPSITLAGDEEITVMREQR